MKEFFRRASEERTEEFRRHAVARADARARFLEAIAEHHREATNKGIALPDLDTYTQQCFELVRDYRRLHDIETPAEADNLNRRQRKRFLRDFREEAREAERILQILHGEMGYPSVREFVHDVVSEIAYRLKSKNNKPT